MESTLYDHLRAGPAVEVWHAVEIVFRERTLRVCDAGTVIFDGKTFLPTDPVYGALGEVSPVSDGTDNEATRAEIEFLPNAEGAADELWLDEDGTEITDEDGTSLEWPTLRYPLEHARRPGNQLSPVTIWWGSTDPETGLVIGEPEGVFVCLLDVASGSIGQGAWSLTFDCCSVLDYALEAGEGYRLNGAFHKEAWPGELGLDFVLSVQQDAYWGETRPRSAITFTGGGTWSRWMRGG